MELFPDPNAVGNAMTSPGSTSAPTLGVQMLGKTADGPPAYKSLPLAAGGGSLVVSGTFFQTTQPVSGTFWQTTQPVSGTVSFSNSTIAVTNSGTFAVQASQSGTWNITSISGTISLPTGASTSAKQPALGMAGSPSTDVLTVQGATSMTALKVDGSGVTQPVSASSLPLPTGAATNSAITGLQVTQGSTTSGQSGDLVQGAVTTNAPTYTTAQTSPLSLTTAGALRVDGSAALQKIQSQAEYNVRAGNAYIASTGVQAATAILGNFRITFQNPNGSGKTIYIYAIISEGTNGTLVFASAFATPTTGLPSSSVASANLAFNGASAVAVIKADVNATALSGGTNFATIGISPNTRSVIKESLFKIPANTLIGINVPFLGTVNANLTVYWWEE